MPERRRHFRGRVYYGGRMTFNERSSTMDCIVRNFSDGGAKVDVAYAGLLTDEMDIAIPCKGVAFRAHMVWRRDNQAGFVFRTSRAAQSVMTLDWALRLRASERSNRALRQSLDALRSEY